MVHYIFFSILDHLLFVQRIDASRDFTIHLQLFAVERSWQHSTPDPDPLPASPQNHRPNSRRQSIFPTRAIYVFSRQIRSATKLPTHPGSDNFSANACSCDFQTITFFCQLSKNLLATACCHSYCPLCTRWFELFETEMSIRCALPATDISHLPLCTHSASSSQNWCKFRSNSDRKFRGQHDVFRWIGTRPVRWIHTHISYVFIRFLHLLDWIWFIMFLKRFIGIPYRRLRLRHRRR